MVKSVKVGVLSRDGGREKVTVGGEMSLGIGFKSEEWLTEAKVVWCVNVGTCWCGTIGLVSLHHCHRDGFRPSSGP